METVVPIKRVKTMFCFEKYLFRKSLTLTNIWSLKNFDVVADVKKRVEWYPDKV